MEGFHQIIHWNCRGIYPNYERLQQLLSNFQPACVCLQELNIGQRDFPIPTGYSVYTSSRLNMGRGGAAVLIKHSVPLTKINIQTDLQAVAVKISIPKKYTICSIYLSPNVEVEDNTLRDLIMQLPRPFLILGDCNSRSPEWGDTTTNRKGRMLSSLMEEHSFTFLNEMRPTFLCSSTDTWSCIDMSLCSTDVLFDFEWDVLRDDYGSDHFPVVLSTKIPTQIDQLKFS